MTGAQPPQAQQPSSSQRRDAGWTTDGWHCCQWPVTNPGAWGGHERTDEVVADRMGLG